MELQIDKSTLPADGQRVKFRTTEEEEWLEGIFIEEDDMFFIDSSHFHFTWHVARWEPIEGYKPKRKLDLNGIARFLTVRRSILIIMLVITIGSFWEQARLFMIGIVFIVWIISMHRDKLLTNRIK